ncbi:MAG: hypothetical protein AB7E59_14810, partial [Pusillimonas sp.]
MDRVRCIRAIDGSQGASHVSKTTNSQVLAASDIQRLKIFSLQGRYRVGRANTAQGQSFVTLSRRSAVFFNPKRSDVSVVQRDISSIGGTSQSGCQEGERHVSTRCLAV